MTDDMDISRTEDISPEARQQNFEQDQQRTRTAQRLGMDEADHEAKIDAEQDQRQQPTDESRYEDKVDESLGDGS